MLNFMANSANASSGSNPGGDLDSFRAQLDVVQIAEMLTEVRRTGAGQGLILCPEHEDHRPSCTVYSDHYFCYTCKAHGDAFRLVMLLRDISFPEALDWISEVTGIDRPRRSPEDEAIAATLRFFRRAFAEELDSGLELPYGLELEAARKLGLGRANQLAALVAEAPRPLLERDEVVAWNGAWTLELHGRGGPLGFGAFPESRARGQTASASAADQEAEIETDRQSEALTDREAEEEAYDLTDEDIPGLAGSEEAPGSSEPGFGLESGSEAISGEPEQRAPVGESALGPFVKSRALRYPAFGGLGAARETIARQHVILLTPDMREMLELQAGGLTGVIGTPGSVDEATTAALAKLAPRLVLITTPERIGTADFLPTLRRLSRTGVSLELVPLSRLRQAVGGTLAGSLGRIPVFSYLAEAAARARAGGDEERARTTLAEWLAVLPSPSTRALYAAEAAKRGLPI